MTSFYLFEANQLVKIPSEYNLTNSVDPKEYLERMLILTSPLTDEERILVGKIVSSTGLNPEEEVKILELASGENFEMSKYDISKLEYALIFDLPAERIPWTPKSNAYEWELQDGFRLIFADSVKALSQSTDLKRKLWTALKKITQK